MQKQFLSVPSLKQVKELTILGNHYQQMLDTIRAAIVKTVEDETGIDLTEGCWSLDTETGVIEHVTTD